MSTNQTRKITSWTKTAHESTYSPVGFVRQSTDNKIQGWTDRESGKLREWAEAVRENKKMS